MQKKTKNKIIVIKQMIFSSLFLIIGKCQYMNI